MKVFITIFFFVLFLSNIINGLTQIEVCLTYLKFGGLQASNNYRTKHSAVPLNLDNYINNISLNYANKLISTFSFDHNPDLEKLGLGENLYQFMSSEPIDLTSKKCEGFMNIICL
jgi:hypothetical protein